MSTTEANPEDLKPLTGREFVEGKRTCDLYPIHEKLPTRFNNPEWFKVTHINLSYVVAYNTLILGF